MIHGFNSVEEMLEHIQKEQLQNRAQSLAESNTRIRRLQNALIDALPHSVISGDDLGNVYLTAGIKAILTSDDVVEIIKRFSQGDWGKHGNYHDTHVTDHEMKEGAFATADDAKLNRIAADKGAYGGILAEYTVHDTRIWVKCDMGVQTTFLLPSEY